MVRIPPLWKANAIAFISSFCVMVIELIAARILAPHIGVSLYTWTSIIGVILAGIALGNYLGGKLADRYPSPLLLAAIFFAGGLVTIGILPATKVVAPAHWVGNWPVMWSFVLKTSCIFFLPAIILSTVSPMVIKLALANLGQTGGVVGTIYACSTAGSILGTFVTGFYLILWFGTRNIVWLVAGALVLTGIAVWLFWGSPGKWRLSLKSLIVWLVIIEVALGYALLFQFRGLWQEKYTRESNYYAIQVAQGGQNVKVLTLDHLIHAYVDPQLPHRLVYDYLKVFAGIVRYIAQDNPAPRVLHLGGGGYSFPRYMEVIYPESVNEVVEIDPVVTEVAHQELGLPQATKIRTYNQDARLFLIQRKTGDKYDIVIADVFSDVATPYHLTTLEFARMLKANMKPDGIYLVNIIDDYYRYGRYMASFVYTLRRVFNHVYLFNVGQSWEETGRSTFIILATDRVLDQADYMRFVTEGGKWEPPGTLHDEAQLNAYLAERKALLLTDDYAPTDILVAPLFR